MTQYTRPAQQHGPMQSNDSPSLGDLFSDLSQNVSILARQEIQLAKVEMQQKAKKASTEIALIIVGGLIGYAALMSLVAAIVLALSQFMNPWLAALAVSLVIGLVAVILIWRGIETLKSMNAAPEHTIATLKEDKEWLTRQMQA